MHESWIVIFMRRQITVIQERSKNTEARARFGKTKIEDLAGKKMNNQHKEKLHIGSSFDDFLSEEVTAVATKRVIAWQISEGMSSLKLSKTAMAKKCIPAEHRLIGCWMKKTPV